MSEFNRHRRSGACVATFSAFEADLLRSLAGQLIELLRSEEATPGRVDPLEAMLDFSGPTTLPEDPVLARLFPAAYADDEAAGEFRRYTEADLRNGKAAAAASIIDALEEAGLPPEPEDGLFVDVELDRATAIGWMRAFTDLRLAIATRLGIEEDTEVFDADDWLELPDDDPRGQVYRIYEWVGFLQESLVQAVV